MIYPSVQEERRESTLRLGEYPYAYARVSVMRSSLLRKDDYHRLLKMGISEITRFLQETVCKKEITELSSRYKGVALLEIALTLHMVRDILKLKRIANDETLQAIIDEYLQRKDVYNLKTILRAIYSKQNKEEAKSLLIPVGRLDEMQLDKLLENDSVEEAISNIPFMPPQILREALEQFKKSGNLFEVENMLSQEYYRDLLRFAKRIPEQGSIMRTFIEEEIDILNIKALLRFKKEKMPASQIQPHLFPGGVRLTEAMLNKMVSAADAHSILNAVEKLGYGVSRQDIEQYLKSGSLIPVDAALSRHLLERVAFLTTTNPLSVDVILGYLFAKEVEISNLRMMIKGKQLGIKEERIEKELVIVR